jgi:excisionase family DNA binding protein
MRTIRQLTSRKPACQSSKKPLSGRLTYTVPEAGQLLGLGRNAAYEAAKRGDIPTIRMGRLLLVPKGPFHKLLGAELIASCMSRETADPIDAAKEKETEA